MSMIEDLEPVIGAVVRDAGEDGLSTEQVRRTLLEQGYVVSDALLSGWLLVMGEQRHLIRWEDGRWLPEDKESGPRRGLDQAVLSIFERAWPRGLGHQDAWAILESQARWESRLAVQLSVIRLEREGELRLLSPGTWRFRADPVPESVPEVQLILLRYLAKAGKTGLSVRALYESAVGQDKPVVGRAIIRQRLARLHDRQLVRPGDRFGMWYITEAGNDVVAAASAQGSPS